MSRPSALLLALESRAIPELGLFATAAPLIMPFVPKGDGHPVLVLPGFMATDTSTAPLRWFLDRIGYEAHGWDVGRNVGPTDLVLDGMIHKLDELTQRYQQPVSIVGWSLGGVYARELARLATAHVRHVVTLGSPFQMEDPQSSNAASIHDLVRANYSDSITMPRIPDRVREPLPVSSTAMFSRTDGIVRWNDCIDVPDAHHDNVEVYGSHCGLGHNPSVLFVVADRLSQQPGEWKPFRSPLALRNLYPKASHVDANTAYANRVAAA